MMENFEGYGAECYLKYIEDGAKGKITQNWNDLTMSADIPIDLEWMNKTCTYTPPKSEWKECTAGEALDAGKSKVRIQMRYDGSTWATIADLDNWSWWTENVEYRLQTINTLEKILTLL